MLYIRGHKIIKGYIGNTPISHVGFGKSGLIKIKSENGGSDYPNNLIAKYTTNTSGVLPTFNSGYQYTVNETESNGIYTVEISSDSDFASCTFSGKTELLTVDYLKVTDKVTTMGSMFYNCSNLTQLDLSNFNTSNVTNMENLFRGCSKLTQLDVSNWDTSKAQYMHHMFNSCSQLTQLDVSNWDTSQVKHMYNMFNNCSQLTQLDVSNWDTSQATRMDNMFHNCSQLTQLDVSNWDTSKVTNMNAMFRSCSKLTQLDVSNWDTNNVKYMSYMFHTCYQVTQLDVSNFNTSNVTDMSDMFNNCSQVTQLDVSNFNTSKVTNMRNFIANTTVLQSFISCAIPVSFEANSTSLTHDSLMSIINNLATVTTTQTLTLGSTNLAKLSSEEKAIAINKGWTLA